MKFEPPLRRMPCGLCRRRWVVIVVVLTFTFRRTPRLMVYVLANQVMGLVLLPALYQLSGQQLNIFTVLLVPLLSAVHLTLLTHVATSFQRAWLAGEEVITAVKSMGREVLRASGFAALTTITGLLALLASDVEQLREFGVLGASGIAMLFGLTFGPGLAWLPLLFATDLPLKLNQCLTANRMRITLVGGPGRIGCRRCASRWRCCWC